jgi:hypothetical protein
MHANVQQHHHTCNDVHGKNNSARVNCQPALQPTQIKWQVINVEQVATQSSVHSNPLNTMGSCCSHLCLVSCSTHHHYHPLLLGCLWFILVSCVPLTLALLRPVSLGCRQASSQLGWVANTACASRCSIVLNFGSAWWDPGPCLEGEVQVPGNVHVFLRLSSWSLVSRASEWHL